jgi:hypothetical protein
MTENGARVLTSQEGRGQATVGRAHHAGMIAAGDARPGHLFLKA